MTAHADDLQATIKSLGWSQQRLADWLSEQTGDTIPLSRVQAWLSSAGYGRTCPGWPLALLRLSATLGAE